MQKIQELTQQDKDRFMGILKDYIQAINQAIDNKEAIPPLEKWKDQLDSILQKINLEVIFSESDNLIQNQVNFFRKNLDEEKYPHKFLSGPYIALNYSPTNRDFTLFFFISQIIPNKNFPTYKGPSEEFFKKEKIFRKEHVYKNQSIFSQKFLDDFLALENAFNSLEIDDFGAIDYLSFYCFHLIFPRIYILDLASVKNNDYLKQWKNSLKILILQRKINILKYNVKKVMEITFMSLQILIIKIFILQSKEKRAKNLSWLIAKIFVIF